MKLHTALFSAVFCVLFSCCAAQAATVLVSFNSTGCGIQAAPCFELPGVIGSDLTGSGSGSLALGLYRPFTDSPEPTSVILFASGIACLGYFGRRRAV